MFFDQEQFYETRERSEELYPGKTAHGGYSNSTGTYDVGPYPAKVFGFRQRTRSKDTAFPEVQRQLHRGTTRGTWGYNLIANTDWGASFLTEKMFVSNSHPWVEINSTGTTRPFYRGPMMAVNSDSYMEAFATSQRNQAEMLELFGLGGTAINRTMPLTPVVDLAVSLGELRKDGLPNLIGTELLRRQTLSRKDYLKKTSSEYLNFQFGILPVANDLIGLAKVAQSQAAIIKQMHRDAGRRVRRQYKFPVKRTTSSVVMATDRDPYTWGTRYDLTTFGGTLVRERTETISTWFSGAYRYHLPNGDSLYDKAAKIVDDVDALLGIKITPETLWNLSPWTWLSDWFLTVGTVVSNASRMGSDGIALQYGYIMRHTERKDDFILSGVTLRGSNKTTSRDLSRIRTTVEYERKERRYASPYGFGLTSADLTAQQKAILVALGITRAPGRF